MGGEGPKIRGGKGTAAQGKEERLAITPSTKDNGNCRGRLMSDMVPAKNYVRSSGDCPFPAEPLQGWVCRCCGRSAHTTTMLVGDRQVRREWQLEDGLVNVPLSSDWVAQRISGGRSIDSLT